MAKKGLDIVVKRIKNKINSIEYIKNNRISEKDFTRNRKLPFKSLILFMLNIIKQTLQKELTHLSRTDKIEMFGDKIVVRKIREFQRLVASRRKSMYQ